ncbi:MAG TPA: hypothetical protein DD473_02705 [Planctomycetaceae bacterium]|nr:hypothetical protein [Planctomycetaceae bacterium]
MQEFYSLGQVAQILGVRQHQITYLLNSKNQKLEPNRVSGRRLFTDDDIRKIAAALGKEVRDA